MARNPDNARTPLSPDATRAILDTDRKRSALTSLSREYDKLLRKVAKQQAPYATLDTL